MTMTPTSADLGALQAILGPGGLVLDPAEMRSYSVAARYGEGRAAAVLRPADSSEVSKILRLCFARDLAVIPQGANTGMVLGSTPDPSGRELVLSLDRMRRIVEIAPENRSVTAEAGVRLSELNAKVEPHALWLPIDLGADPTIGGMVSTNTGGARFLRYGDVRKHLLGLQVVLADPEGSVVTLGGLRKDNARLDLKDLIVGSCGAIGVVTEATLEVRQRPRQTAAAFLVPKSPQHSLDVLMHFELHAGELLSAFEGISGAAMGAARSVPNVRTPFAGEPPDYALLVELATALSASVLDLDQALEALLVPLCEHPTSPLQDAIIAPPAELWRLRHSLSEGLKASGRVIGFDLAFRRDRVMAFRTEAIQLLARVAPEIRVCDFGHIGDGGVHFNLVAPRSIGLDAIEGVRQLVLDLAVEIHGGSFSGEHGLGRINQAAYDRYTPPSERRRANALLGALNVKGLGVARWAGSGAMRVN